MDALISRVTAISAIVHELDAMAHVPQRVTDRLVNVLNEVPALVVNKPGKWELNCPESITYKYRCTTCGAYHRARYNFCPTCGTRMEG